MGSRGRRAAGSPGSGPPARGFADAAVGAWLAEGSEEASRFRAQPGAHSKGAAGRGASREWALGSAGRLEEGGLHTSGWLLRAWLPVGRLAVGLEGNTVLGSGRGGMC